MAGQCDKVTLFIAKLIVSIHGVSLNGQLPGELSEVSIHHTHTHLSPELGHYFFFGGGGATILVMTFPMWFGALSPDVILAFIFAIIYTFAADACCV